MMTHDELVRRLAKEANLWLYQSRAALEALVSIIESEVENGDGVRIKKFGRFESQEYAPKVGRNLWTMEEVMIPAHRGMVFKPTRRLKDLDKEEDVEERDAG